MRTTLLSERTAAHMSHHSLNVLPVHVATAPCNYWKNLGSKRSHLGILFLVVAILAIIAPSRTASTRRLEATPSESPRPVIYTFFTQRTDIKRRTDATGKSEHQLLLQAWSTLWTEAGWDPKVLTLSDAKLHPDYQKYADAVSKTENAHEGSYDFMCFMRWLAMSARGTGGWMSDYDTFPLDITVQQGRHLPNEGRFTSHQRHVPALLSGSASEWDRMAKEVMEMAAEKASEKFYSDMYALVDLREKSSEIYMEEWTVVSCPYKAAGVLDCKSTETALAAHLSHATTHKAFEAGYVASRDRHLLAYELANNWREQCKSHRPVIHTFFTQRSDVSGGAREHQDLLDAWMKLWTKAGWETKILTLEDSKKHPDFRRYNAIIPQIKNVAEESFDYINFMRWLAMSSQKTGGFMSDYDTFPLGITAEVGLTLPNDGRFTSYQSHVPALVSGCAEEWDRLALEVLDMATSKVNEDYYSDMRAMVHLYESEKPRYIQETKVAYLFPYKGDGTVDCEVANANLAVHLSNKATEEAMSKGLVKTKDRHVLAYNLLNQWQEQCKPNPSFVSVSGQKTD